MARSTELTCWVYLPQEPLTAYMSSLHVPHPSPHSLHLPHPLTPYISLTPQDLHAVDVLHPHGVVGAGAGRGPLGGVGTPWVTRGVLEVVWGVSE